MVESTLQLLTDDELHARMALASREAAKLKFCDDRIVPMYEAYYESILAKSTP
jgi:hypothetical protein